MASTNITPDSRSPTPPIDVGSTSRTQPIVNPSVAGTSSNSVVSPSRSVPSVVSSPGSSTNLAHNNQPSIPSTSRTRRLIGKWSWSKIATVLAFIFAIIVGVGGLKAQMRSNELAAASLVIAQYDACSENKHLKDLPRCRDLAAYIEPALSVTKRHSPFFLRHGSVPRNLTIMSDIVARSALAVDEAIRWSHCRVFSYSLLVESFEAIQVRTGNPIAPDTVNRMKSKALVELRRAISTIPVEASTDMGSLSNLRSASFIAWSNIFPDQLKGKFVSQAKLAKEAISKVVTLQERILTILFEAMATSPGMLRYHHSSPAKLDNFEIIFGPSSWVLSTKGFSVRVPTDTGASYRAFHRASQNNYSSEDDQSAWQLYLIDRWLEQVEGYHDKLPELWIPPLNTTLNHSRAMATTGRPLTIIFQGISYLLDSTERLWTGCFILVFLIQRTHPPVRRHSFFTTSLLLDALVYIPYLRGLSFHFFRSFPYFTLPFTLYKLYAPNVSPKPISHIFLRATVIFTWTYFYVRIAPAIPNPPLEPTFHLANPYSTYLRLMIYASWLCIRASEFLFLGLDLYVSFASGLHAQEINNVWARGKNCVDQALDRGGLVWYTTCAMLILVIVYSNLRECVEHIFGKGAGVGYGACVESAGLQVFLDNLQITPYSQGRINDLIAMLERNR